MLCSPRSVERAAAPRGPRRAGLGGKARYLIGRESLARLLRQRRWIGALSLSLKRASSKECCLSWVAPRFSTFKLGCCSRVAFLDDRSIADMRVNLSAVLVDETQNVRSLQCGERSFMLRYMSHLASKAFVPRPRTERAFAQGDCDLGNARHGKIFRSIVVSLLTLSAIADIYIGVGGRLG